MIKILFLETGEPVVLDDWIYPEVIKYRWYLNEKGYVQNQNSFMRLHRFVTQARPGMCVRFRNSERLDLRLANLEVTLTPAKLRELKS